MADPLYSVKKITDLTTNPSTNDSDLYVLGNQGTATMRKITFSTIASAILNKLTSFTFNSLTTSSKNLPGAVNELNTKTSTYTHGNVTWESANVNGNNIRRQWDIKNGLVVAHLEFTPLSGKIAANNVICTGLPIPRIGERVVVYSVGNQQMAVDSYGNLVWYFPTDTTSLHRIDTTLVYFASS